MEANRENATKIYCNICKGVTNHVLRGSYTTSRNSIPDEGVWESDTWELYSCAGCESPTLRGSFDASWLNRPYEQGGERFYPERQTSDHTIKTFRKLPDSLKGIYIETIRALNSGCLLLCTIGLRTLLEGICKDKGAKGANLEARINNLRPHFASDNIIQSIHGFRFAGNEAAHDLIPLKRDEALMAVIVMEDLLNYLYDMDYKASLLKHAAKGVKKP